MVVGSKGVKRFAMGELLAAIGARGSNSHANGWPKNVIQNLSTTWIKKWPLGGRSQILISSTSCIRWVRQWIFK